MNAELKGKRVFLTGATGFIGGYLAHRLHAEGARVLALERKPGKGAELAALGIDVVRGDIKDHDRMRELTSDVDLIIHAAARLAGGSRADHLRDNVEATRNLAQAAADASVERFVFISSIAVYGGLDSDGDVDEEASLRLFGAFYGDTKILAESAVQEVAATTDLVYSIARPGMVYGPRSPAWTVRLARLAKRGLLPLVDGGRGTAHPIYIDDLVDGLLLCTTHPRARMEAFNFVDDGPITWTEFFGAYMRMIPTNHALRVPGSLLALLSPLAPGVGLGWAIAQLRGCGLVLNRKARELLSWQPKISLTEGMRRSESWLRQVGLL